MADSFADFSREPSKPHQCTHRDEDDGHRCRATAMHNEYVCFHHRRDAIPTVIENAPYDLPDCIDFARHVEASNIFWLEEPLHWYLQPADFARLAAATPIRCMPAGSHRTETAK